MIQLIDESLIQEKLEEVSNNVFCTDYVGDITNWLLNKPKAYRMLYDTVADVWCIADALVVTHSDMAYEMWRSGYVQEHMREDFIEDIKYYADKHGISSSDAYASYWFREFKLIGIFFIPNGKDYFEYEDTGFYDVQIPISTGTLFVKSNFYLTENGCLKDLYNKLAAVGALSPRVALDESELDVRNLERKRTPLELVGQIQCRYKHQLAGFLDYIIRNSREDVLIDNIEILQQYEDSGVAGILGNTARELFQEYDVAWEDDTRLGVMLRDEFTEVWQNRKWGRIKGRIKKIEPELNEVAKNLNDDDWLSSHTQEEIEAAGELYDKLDNEYRELLGKESITPMWIRKWKKPER